MESRERNPESREWNTESKEWNPKSMEWNPESKDPLGYGANPGSGWFSNTDRNLLTYQSE